MQLILNTFGTSLQKEDGIFLIKTQDGRKKISPDKVKSICISRGAKISSDAALLAIENEIEVMFIDKVGNPVGRLWSVKYGSISTIRKNQIEFTSSKAAVDWIKEIIIQKSDNQIALLLSLDTLNDKTENIRINSINKIDVYKKKITEVEALTVNEISATIRGWEGAASKAYFDAICEFLPEKMKFAKRSQHPAEDVFNMLLNYGYGMLYGKIEGALIKAGIDPYVGVFHRDQYNRPVLAYDIIEIYRVWVDYVVISLCLQEVIDNDCYSITENGFWLESMGKRILIQSVNDYLDEIVQINKLERSRAVHIDLFAQNLAQKLLNFKV